MTPIIGFIGLGHMGNPMVCNLLKAGYTVKVYDVVSESISALEKQGAVPTHSIAELASDADILITMVQTGKQVMDIALNSDGLFSHARKNCLYIDSSSIDIASTLDLHKKAHDCGIAMVDAPVSGGVAGALAGTLTIMVGGSVDNFKRSQSILTHLGKKIFHAGKPGNGQAAKICNNLLLGISMVGVCEAFSLAEKLGLDPRTFFEISSNASGQCWSMTSYCPAPGILENAPSSHDYQPGFMAKMMLKDLRLGQHAAEMHNLPIPLGASAAELYALYVSQGFGDLDFSGIIKLIGKIK